MALSVKLYNLARMTTATTGTGNTLTLGSAVQSFLSFGGAGLADAETFSYAIEDGGNREVGTAVYTASGTTMVRTVGKSTNGNANINLSGNAQVFITPRAEDLRTPPTIQSFTTGTSQTYTTPANCLYLKLRMVGSGGGSDGTGAGRGGGSDGGDTIFGSFTAKGGKGGAVASTAQTGGDVNITGQQGTVGHAVAGEIGSQGGGNPLGSGGPGNFGNGIQPTGFGGGAGSPSGTAANAAGSGGSGGYLEKIIVNPVATYTYTIGAASTGGGAGTSGGAGAAGATGIIIVEEYYGP